MNRSITRICLGIAIYLSSSLMYGSTSFAVSLKFSDRYEPSKSEGSTFFDEEFFKTRSDLNPDLTLQQQPQDSANFAEFELQQQPQDSSNFTEFELQQQPQDSSDFAELDNSQLLISYLSEEAFSNSTLNIQVQGSNTDSEDINLLESLTSAIGNLQFDSVRDNSFINPNVVILPQVSYQDIYRGLYDFNINLVSSRFPGVVNNSIPKDTLISQESISNYNSAFTNPPFFRSNYLGSSNATTPYYSNTSSSNTSSSNTPSSGLLFNATNTTINNNLYEDISTRLESVLSENTNVYTNGEEINVPSGSRFVTPTDKFNSQKSEKLRELEQERQQQEIIKARKRQALQRKIQQERAQRQRQRQMQAINTRRKRETELRKQLQRQQKALQRQ